MDEDIQAKLLVILLKKAGHDVITINELNFMGKQDPLILDYAKKENRVLLTRVKTLKLYMKQTLIMLVS
jgi:predicted nuclease of predicted toxin-antitoxin system